MKYIALIIILTLSLSKAAHAENSLERFCTAQQALYENIMKRRQEGETLIEQIRFVNKLKIIDTYIIEIILTAYEMPQVESEKIDWFSTYFGKRMYDTCISTDGYGEYD